MITSFSSKIALAVTLAFATGACLDDGSLDEPVEDDDELTMEEGEPEFETAANGFQADCGVFTCTVRLNRANTKKARSAGQILTTLGTGCGLLSGPFAPACVAAVAIPGVGLTHFAGKYYDAGNCLGIRFPKAPPPGNAAWPVQVKKGSKNCK